MVKFVEAVEIVKPVKIVESVKTMEPVKIMFSIKSIKPVKVMETVITAINNDETVVVKIIKISLNSHIPTEFKPAIVTSVRFYGW